MSNMRPPDKIEALGPYLSNLTRDNLKDLAATREPSGPVALPDLEGVLKRHIEKLDEGVLLHLSRLGLHSLFDNYNIVLMCAEELIRRRHIEAQHGFMDIVIAAREEYDPGHRDFENTVLDQLIDTLLARFELEPLIHLLSGLDYDVLSTDGSDGFAVLFEAAFEKLQDTPPPALLESLADYVNDSRKHGEDLSGLTDTLRGIRSRNNIPAVDQALEAHLKQLEADLKLEALFDTEDPVTAAELIERLGRDIPFLIAKRFHVTSSLLYHHAKTLPFEALRDMYTRCFANERDTHYPETDLGRLLFPLFVNDPEQAKQFSLNLAKQSGEHDFTVKCVEWAVRDGHHEEEASLQTAKDCLALLRGLDPTEERAREALKNRRSSLTSTIGWALSHGNLDEARQLFDDPDNRAILTSDMVEDIITDFSLEENLESGNYEVALKIVVFDFDLLDYKNHNPDPLPTGEKKKLSIEELSRIEQEGKPGGFSLERFLSLALVLAVHLDASHTDLIERIETLSLEALDAKSDQISYAPIAYNLCCLFARRGDKQAFLEYLPVSLRHGHEKDQFLTDEDFKAYWEDADVLRILETAGED